MLFTRLHDSAKPPVRSQGGPRAGLALTTCPTCLLTRLEPQLFRVLLLRRLRLSLSLLPVWPTTRLLWPPPRSMRTSKGVWQTRVGFGVVARVCREAGGRVMTNVMLRDLDMALPNVADGRRLEVVADGLPLFGGAQLSIDTTLVRPPQRRQPDAIPWSKTVPHSGELADGRNGRTLNWWAAGLAPGWSFW